MKTAAEAIREAMVALGGEASVRDVESFVEQRIPRQWRPGTVATSMADLTYPGNASSTYPTSQRFLVRVRRSTYRLRATSRT